MYSAGTTTQTDKYNFLSAKWGFIYSIKHLKTSTDFVHKNDHYVLNYISIV